MTKHRAYLHLLRKTMEQSKQSEPPSFTRDAIRRHPAENKDMFVDEQRSQRPYVCLSSSGGQESPSLASKTYARDMTGEQQQQQQAASPMASNGTMPTPVPTTSTGAPLQHRHLPQVFVAKILTMILQNGVALATRQARPNTIALLNQYRTELLMHCPFFDPAHKPEELGPRTRRSQVSFTDIVVLMARLMRVLMKPGNLTEAEERERMEVRNECLDQPFFSRALLGSARPFVDDDGFMDEGCVV